MVPAGTSSGSKAEHVSPVNHTTKSIHHLHHHLHHHLVVVEEAHFHQEYKFLLN